MSYTLISSRTRSTDESFVLVEPELSAASIMVEALSFLSRFRRVAGWMYQTIPSTPGNYERANGQMVLFGRNRLDLVYYDRPFGLEFFPRYGNTNFALSVYTGFASVDPPPVDGWVRVPSSGREFKLFSLEGKIKSRMILDGSAQFDVREGVADAFINGNDLYIRFFSTASIRIVIGVWNEEYTVATATYNSLRSDPGSRVLPA